MAKKGEKEVDCFPNTPNCHPQLSPYRGGSSGPVTINIITPGKREKPKEE